MGINGVIARWRHSRGFGVHSPFAFRMVTEVVRAPRAYAYYGYALIDSELRRDPTERRFILPAARLLLRVAVALEAESVCLPPGAHKAFRAAIRGAGRHIRIVRDPQACRLLVTDSVWPDAKTAQRHLSHPGHALLAFARTPAEVGSIAAAMPGGMLLHSGGSRPAILAVCRTDMPLVRHQINFDL